MSMLFMSLMISAKTTNVNGHEEIFMRHASHIVWKTEVWVAETLEHMIHYNGDKFLGSHE